MKKRIMFLGLLLAIVMVVSAVGFVSFAGEAKAALDVSVTNLQLLDVKMASVNDKDNTAKRVSFTINRNLGGNSFTVCAPTVDKVVYTAVGGSTRTLSGIYYRLFNTVSTLVFSFSEDTGEDRIGYSVGDTLTIKANFSFSNWDGSSLNIIFPEDKTFTYTAEGWTGTFMDASLSVPSLSVGGISYSGNALIFDFGVNGSGAEDHGLVDKDSGWYAVEAFAPAKLVYENTNLYVDYMRGGVKYDRVRFLFTDGKFGVDLGVPGTDNDPKAKDVVILKKGFVLVSITNIDSGVGYTVGDNNYRPYLVLHKDLSFYFDGTSWGNTVAATTANFTNTPEEKNTLIAGTTLQLKWELDAAAKEPYPTFSTNAADKATVNAQGLVTGIAMGEVTITAQFLNISKEITLIVGTDAAKDKIATSVTNGSEREGVKYLVAYKGVDLVKAEVAKKITAKFGYDNGAFGSEFVVTESMIDLTVFNNTVAGETKILVTNEGISGEVPVYVYETAIVDPLLPSKVVSWGNAIDLHFDTQIAGDEIVEVLSVDFRGANPYGIPASMITFREPTHATSETVYEFYTIGQVTNKQMLLYFGNVDGGKMSEERVGCVLSLHDNFRFYRFIDHYWIAAYQLSAPISYVWDGTKWQNFVADATDVTLSETVINLPLNAEYALKYSLLPENSYVIPTVVSGDSAIAEIVNGQIVGKAIGETTISVTVGTSTKTINIHVVESNPTSFVLENDRVFNVAKNGVFNIGKVSARLDFGNNFYGEVFQLTEENTEYELNTAIVGKQDLIVKITHTEFGKTVVKNVTIKIEVHDLIEQVPNSLWDSHDISWANGAIMVLFENTFPNGANVYPENLSEAEAATIIDHIFYTREGSAVTVHHPGYLKNMLAFSPQINGVTITTYQVGDKIKLTAGLKFYKFFGELDANNVPIHKEKGDFVNIGELKYDVVFTYLASGKFWMDIEYANVKALSESVTVGLNAKHASNVAVVPEYATNGEWSFKVADESVATINVNGLISGKKIGRTLVTATLSGGTAGDKVVTFTINVVDIVTGIELTAKNPISVVKGSELTVQKLLDMGVTGKLKYASGKIEGVVDLKNVKISGYDSDKLGEQTIIIRASVDGKSITGELKITVAEVGATGCSGSLSGTLGGYGSLFAVLIVCSLAIVGKKFF